MVFDAFRIAFCDASRHTQRAQECDDQFVPFAAAPCEAFASGREKDGSVRLGVDELFTLQTCNGADHGDVADTHELGQIDNAGLALRLNEHGDGFDIVLRQLIGVGGADRRMRGGASTDRSARDRTSARRAGHAPIIARVRIRTRVVVYTLCSSCMTL